MAFPGVGSARKLLIVGTDVPTEMSTTCDRAMTRLVCRPGVILMLPAVFEHRTLGPYTRCMFTKMTFRRCDRHLGDVLLPTTSVSSMLKLSGTLARWPLGEMHLAQGILQ